MTVKMLTAWNGYPKDYIGAVISAPEEARLVSIGFASYDLDGVDNDGVRVPVTSTVNPLTGGIELSVDLGAPSGYYLSFIPGKQFVTSGVPKDLSGKGANAVLGSALTDAALWANNGYMTTAAGANLAMYVPTASSAFNLATESVIFSALMNKAAPGVSENTFGNGNAATKEGFYLSVRATTGAIRPVFGTSAGYITGLPDSVAAFADGTDHVVTFAYDAQTKVAYLYRDGALMNTYATGITGTTTPASPFAIGGTEGLIGVAAKSSGVHLLKMTGGLPPNIHQIASRLAASPHAFLRSIDIIETGRVKAAV